MSASNYTLQNYISDLKQIAGEESDASKVVERVTPLAARLGVDRGWIKKEDIKFNEEQGFGIRLLHEEPNHDLAVFLFSWLPNRGTLPHNHKTWAVVVGLEGEEKEVHFRRMDNGSKPGHAVLEKTGDLALGSGDVTTCLPEDIHSVWNYGETPSLSLHTYGRHINHTGRSEFDLDRNEERPYRVAVD